MRYPQQTEIVLGDVPEIVIPEIKVSYSRDTGIPLFGKVFTHGDILNFVRNTFDKGTLELQEQFIVIYLNLQNEIIGYYRHTVGAITSVTADIRIILGVAVQCGCISLLVAHNHPSGGLQPSEPDKNLTKKLKAACAVHNITLLDHFIITKDGHYSFSSQRLLGLEGVAGLINKAEQFVTRVIHDLVKKVSHNKRSIEKLAVTFGITNKTEVKELVELAIVKRARELAHSEGSIKDRFDKIVELYYSQVNLSHRTSQSILLQQYSTPAPIGYLAGVFCGIDKFSANNKALEPSAGNGMLTVAGSPSTFEVNEIDPVRNKNLQTQGFFEVKKSDATKLQCRRVFDAVLTNPPFGVLLEKSMFDSFPITTLEHAMALRALDCMKDNGKAAVIIGGHTRWDKKGRVQAGRQRIFLNYLYSRYHVADIININGHKLYSRQGTAFDVRLILIDGRKNFASGNAPVYNPDMDKEVKTFDELFDRVMDAMDEQPEPKFVGSALLPIYIRYTSLKKNNPNAILFIRQENTYYTFDKDATTLMTKAGFGGSGEIHYEGRKIRITSFRAETLDHYLSMLVKAGFKVAIADELITPKDNDMKRLELEAEALALEFELELASLDGLSGLNYIDRRGRVNDDAMFKEYKRLKKEHPEALILLETPSTFQTFDEDAILLAKITGSRYMKCFGFNYYAMEGIIRTEQYVVKRKIEKAGYTPIFVENKRANHVFKAYNTVLPIPRDLIEYEIKYGKRHTEQDAINYSRYLKIKDHNTKNIVVFKTGREYTIWAKDAETVIKAFRRDYDKSLIDINGVIIKGYTFSGRDLKLYTKYFQDKGYKMIVMDKALGELPAIPGNINKTMYRHYTYTRPQYSSRHNLFFLLKNEATGEYETYDMDAERMNYMFSIPLTLFAIINGKKVHGVSLTPDKIASIRKHIEEAGYQVLTEENPNSFKGLDDESASDDDIVDHEQLFRRYNELRPVFPGELILLETPGTYVTFNDDAITLAKTLKIAYINFRGPGYEYIIAAISKILIPNYFEQLQKAGIEYTIIPNGKKTDWKKLEDEALWLHRLMNGENEDLGAPYEPASQACVVLNTQVPDSMAFETSEAVKLVQKEVGGNMDNFVRHRLRYPNKAALCKVLSAEQIDAVAMAIYNIEARGQGMIIGDQTGIGKGRIAASMIRYAIMQGLKPVFLTEKANLFSDIYRDLAAIGSAHLKPFIVNGRESKTDIKDEDGEIIYQAPPPAEQQNIIASREVPAGYDFVLGTYSQFNSAEKKPEKPNFLRAIAPGNIFIMDEAHNSSGSSNTGEFMQGVIRDTKGVVFLSATFAKRPDNMPIYAMKTAIADCNMTRDELVDAITKGGVALQEVLSSQLVAEGQMLRRERSFEGVEVNYISLDDKAEEHKAISDNITKILRDIIAFQSTYIDKMVEELDDIAVAEGKQIEIREGTSQAGVDNLPYFSKVFQVINQMLFSLKAEAVAERTIARLKEGKKPVIAFASTMGNFIESMENEHRLPVADGDTINTDFAEVLRKGLDGIMRYTEKDIDGNPIYKRFEISELSTGAQQEYQRIMERITTVSTGISISPIDVIIKKLKDAGYSVAEVTGRKYEVQVNLKTNKGLVLSRKRINTNDAFRKFNNNEVDVLMINQSGSTGASAHAIPTSKVPTDQVRQRVMIVLQAELDISTEVQKRGRINRTGQLLKPIYDYVTSAIPAEKRLMMMLQKKLKSLDANTTSNQKQSTKILDVPDFLNKYGDKIVKEYLMENKEVNNMLDDPLQLKESMADSDSNNRNILEEAAHRVSGRVAVLSTQMQQDFYNEVSERYNDYVDYLKQVGEYDLEVEAMNLEAETTKSGVIKMGKGSDNAFGDDSILETVKANVLKKPFTKVELENLIAESLKGRDPQILQQEVIADYESGIAQRLQAEEGEVHAKYDLLKMSIPAEKKIQKILGKEGQATWQEAIKQREEELQTAREAQLFNLGASFNYRKQYLQKIFKVFYIGRFLSYPVETYEGGKEVVPTVFLGLMIDKKKKNPYAPSAMKLRFAIANSSKYLAIPASYNEEILAIIGSSVDTPQPPMDELLQQWEEYTKQSYVDRKTRHIITGNLLQAFSDFKGKLVSYTTINKETKKGILLPENWNPDDHIQRGITVPILKALRLIKSIVQNGHIVTNNGISFFRQGDHFRIIVAASRSKGGDIYLDKEILELVENNNFEKTSDKMVAKLPEKHITKLVELLQNNHNCSVSVPESQIRELDIERGGGHSTRKPILLPDEEKEEDVPDNMHILELEAEALILELELLAA